MFAKARSRISAEAQKKGATDRRKALLKATLFTTNSSRFFRGRMKEAIPHLPRVGCSVATGVIFVRALGDKSVISAGRYLEREKWEKCFCWNVLKLSPICPRVGCRNHSRQGTWRQKRDFGGATLEKGKSGRDALVLCSINLRRAKVYNNTSRKKNRQFGGKVPNNFAKFIDVSEDVDRYDKVP
ncbi:hypothetical protein CDAR_582321 [Caerostris darwini]|uniref:Uncharacterized protein n=1 Tax=Caerostris darwini TaxID=1538125 RepID=A0AAV4RKY7_9ARAC|nr:hypothetical protein CDAR_582321 [Caerostris darwini]